MNIRFRTVLLSCLLTAGCQQAAESPAPESARREPAEPVTAIPVAQAAPGDLVDMRLRVETDDRFPLIKTVEQQVIQQSDASNAVAITRLQLSLMLSVVESTPESVLFDVKYTRIHYAHNVDGRHSVYDSSSPSRTIPYDAVPWAGMVGNGYAIRIGHDHKVVELIGHDDFLQRSLAHVPDDRRQSLMNETAVRFGDEGVAGFVPDTFGLLPYDRNAPAELASRVQEGDSWDVERKLMQPVPVHLKSTCRVVQVSPTTAEFDIAGRIIPGQTYSPSGSGTRSSVRILGGTTQGICLFDRGYGIPIDVQRRERLHLQVTTSSGAQVQQEKRISTRIRVYPEERGPIVRSNSTDPGIRPVSAESSGEDLSVVPIPAMDR